MASGPFVTFLSATKFFPRAPFRSTTVLLPDKLTPYTELRKIRKQSGGQGTATLPTKGLIKQRFAERVPYSPRAHPACQEAALKPSTPFLTATWAGLATWLIDARMRWMLAIMMHNLKLSVVVLGKVVSELTTPI
jgi:hypothetical protein